MKKTSHNYSTQSARLQQNDTVAQLTDKVLLAALDSKAPVTPDDDDNIFSRYIDEDKLQSSQIDEEMLSIETEECNLVPEDMEDVDIQPDISKDFWNPSPNPPPCNMSNFSFYDFPFFLSFFCLNNNMP